jgi:hypothetical protein
MIANHGLQVSVSEKGDTFGGLAPEIAGYGAGTPIIDLARCASLIKRGGKRDGNGGAAKKSSKMKATEKEAGSAWMVDGGRIVVGHVEESLQGMIARLNDMEKHSYADDSNETLPVKKPRISGEENRVKKEKESSLLSEESSIGDVSDQNKSLELTWATIAAIPPLTYNIETTIALLEWSHLTTTNPSAISTVEDVLRSYRTLSQAHKSRHSRSISSSMEILGETIDSEVLVEDLTLVEEHDNG